MLTEDQILLYLYKDNWFVPSKKNDFKQIKDEDGSIIEVPKSYYHKYGSPMIQKITIRVSEHGTSLNTWIRHSPTPNTTLQNLSVVFSQTPASSTLKTVPVEVKENGRIVKKYLYFVVEQYCYNLRTIDFKSFKKIIKIIKGLSDDAVFNDPFITKPSKTASRKVLLPQNQQGEYIPSSANTVHPRQTVVATNKDNEVDAQCNVIPNRLNSSKDRLGKIIAEVITRFLKREVFNT